MASYMSFIKSHNYLDIVKNFKDEVENQLSKRIKSIRSDRGGEYYNKYDGLGEDYLLSF